MKMKKDEFALNYGGSHGQEKELSAEEVKALKRMAHKHTKRMDAWGWAFVICSIPEDISIAGFDGSDIMANLDPKLTTIVQDTRMMGRIAADNLIDWIENPDNAHEEHTVIEGVLEKGASVRQLSRA